MNITSALLTRNYAGVCDHNGEILIASLIQKEKKTVQIVKTFFFRSTEEISKSMLSQHSGRLLSFHHYLRIFPPNVNRILVGGPTSLMINTLAFATGEYGFDSWWDLMDFQC